MSTFAKWQPVYAQHGIATFPVTAEKKPATRGYLRTGLRYSAQLALDFADADAFGFALGRRLTVLDIDTSDERVLADALSVHGDTPLISRTASGGFHGYYRNAGERRLIRAWGDDVPIDQLGGGFAIGPPSLVAAGRYEFIRGSVADLDRLPIMRAPALAPAPGLGSAAEFVPHGKRNKALYEHCMRAAHHCDDFDAVLDVARTFVAMQCEVSVTDPMTDDDIIKTVKWVWRKTLANENRFGRRRVEFDANRADNLIRTDLDRFILEAFLRANQGPQATFMAANEGLAKIFGWEPRRVAAARRRMIAEGDIVQIKRAGRGSAALYRWEGRTK
jgi:hypothetical protein